MMEQSPEITLPDHLVALRIVERLLGKQLVSQELADTLQERFVDGSFKEADWRLFAEKTLDLEKRGGNDDH